MPAPTRQQIEAPVRQPTYQVSWWSGSAWVDFAAQDVASIAPQHQTSTDLHGLAFGVSVGAGCTIAVRDTPALRSLAWEQLRVRVRFGFGTSDLVHAFVGVIVRRQRDGTTITWTCEGLETLMRGIPVYSPMLYARRVATATSPASIENPDQAGWSGGMINYLLWTCGGRPLEQQASYPSALFWYTCQDALIAPPWSWVSGENVWDELQRLCKVGGGQIAQRPDGVIQYVNPLAFGSVPSSPYLLTDASIASVTEDGAARETVASVRGRISVRQLQPEQTVYEDTTPRLLPASGLLDIVCDLEWPVYAYVYAAAGAPWLALESLTVTTIFGVPATADQVTAQVLSSGTGAGRAAVRLTNLSTIPLILSRLTLRGRPVTVVTTEQAVSGSGTPQLELSSDLEPLIQSPAQFAMLGSLYRTVYGVARPVITLEGRYDPDRWVGERCLLHLPTEGYAMHPIMIVGLDVQDGSAMTIQAVSVAGLPTVADFFIVGQTYVTGTVKQLGY